MSGTGLFMSYYIAVLALLMNNVIGIRPSVAAAAAVCLARVIVNERPAWPEDAETYSGVRFADIQALCWNMHSELRELTQLAQLSAHIKFESKTLGAVARLPIPETIAFA
jgi:hypothetical protein